PNGQQEYDSISFNVAEYRAPEYSVSVSAQQDQIVQGDSLNVAVEGRYFFGGALSDAQVNYYVYTQPYAFDYTGDGYYVFGSDDLAEDLNLNYGAPITEGTATTDA